MPSLQKDDDTGATAVICRKLSKEDLTQLALLRLLGTRHTIEAGEKRCENLNLWVPFRGYLFHIKRKQYAVSLRDNEKIHVHYPHQDQIYFLMDAAAAFSPHKYNIKGTKNKMKLFTVIGRFPKIYYVNFCILKKLPMCDLHDNKKKYYEIAVYFLLEEKVTMDCKVVETIKKKILNYFPDNINQKIYKTVFIADSCKNETKNNFAISLSTLYSDRNYEMMWTPPHHMTAVSGRVDAGHTNFKVFLRSLLKQENVYPETTRDFYDLLKKFDKQLHKNTVFIYEYIDKSIMADLLPSNYLKIIPTFKKLF